MTVVAETVNVHYMSGNSHHKPVMKIVIDLIPDVEERFHAVCFRSAYPLGLPQEFAFVAVLCMTGSTINKNWNIWQMQDVNGTEQLNGESKSLEVTLAALDAGRQDVIFGSTAPLFNNQWHKVLWEVRRASVTLYLDCAMIDSQAIAAWRTISLDGFTLIGKLKNNPLMAIPVRLSWRTCKKVCAQK